MGTAGEQCDKKWMVNMNRLLGEQRGESREEGERAEEWGEWRRRRGEGGRRAGLWGQLWSRAKEQRMSKSGDGEVVEEEQ